MSDIEKLCVKLDEKEYTFEPMKDVIIDKENFENELYNQAEKYAWAVTVTEALHAKANAADAYVEYVYAKLDAVKREELTKSAVKLTESIVKSAITVDDEYQAALKGARDAEESYQMMKAFSRALEQRKDMLLQISAFRRKEYDSFVDRALTSLKEKGVV